MGGERTDGPQLFTRKILIIDDDEAYGRIVALQLRAAGYRCRTAFTHADAVQQIQVDYEIGVILLDYSMYGRDPGPVVDQLTKLRPHVCIIGHSTANRSREFAALGVRYFFRKPLQVNRLTQLLMGFPVQQL